MENATKALLIAAAVLVAILIISLGLVVYNMAAEATGAIDFSTQEIATFNDKFMQYKGSNVRGSDVKAMLKTVLNSNMETRAGGAIPNGNAGANNPKFVEVVTEDGDLILEIDDTAIPVEIDTIISTSITYPVTVSMNTTTGFVDQIIVGGISD